MQGCSQAPCPSLSPSSLHPETLEPSYSAPKPLTRTPRKGPRPSLQGVESIHPETLEPSYSEPKPLTRAPRPGLQGVESIPLDNKPTRVVIREMLLNMKTKSL